MPRLQELYPEKQEAFNEWYDTPPISTITSKPQKSSAEKLAQSTKSPLVKTLKYFWSNLTSSGQKDIELKDIITPKIIPNS